MTDHADGSRTAATTAEDILKGAVAGAVATWVMDRADWFMYDRESDDVHRQTREARPRHMDPAHVMAAEGAQAVGVELAPRQLDQAGMAVHYALGIAPAMIYGATRTRVPGVGAGRGLAFGAAMFVIEDEALNPALGFAAGPSDYPWQAHARGLVAHLIYGVVTDAVLRAFTPSRPRAGSPARRRGPDTPELRD